ncbi:tetratricopeptide repeat protein [Fluviispira vulneris]|uniref:tetratricopeptide repeat protein n=1 Tax=Fluviispira vulneris TaxID=2763012 RepID=UPI0016440538|nr:tetratricopeptide repeat protein [Fluviispira vulneris]
MSFLNMKKYDLLFNLTRYLPLSSLNKKSFLFCSISSSLFLTGCMTSSRQDQLQSSISQLQGQIFQIQEQLSKRDQQITNTTQTAISSQNEVQNLQTQIQLTQGSVDELKARLKRMEETAGSTGNEQNVVTLSNSPEFVALQRHIARIDLVLNTRLNNPKKGKLPEKLKTVQAITKSLKNDLEQNKYKQLIDNSTAILNAHDASDSMQQIAIEYRAEARFKTQDYKNAVLDFTSYIEKFPDAPKNARALLLTGDSYVYLNNNSIAKTYYQECAKVYANMPEGKAATSRLANLMAQTTSSQTKAQ